jgi:TonB family protein
MTPASGGPAATQARHGRGLFIVIILGVIFVALIVMLVIATGRHSSTPPPPTETLTVLPLRVRLRTEPNAKAAVVATATSGEKLTIVDDRGAWVRVQDSEGLNGWVERSSLERTTERERRLAIYAAIRKLPALDATVSQRTPLYAGPGIFYPIIGELPASAQVKVFTRDHDFFAVDHEGTVAYLDIDAVQLSTTGAPQLDVRTTAETTGTAPRSTDTVAPPLPATETQAAEMPPAPEPQAQPQQPAPSAERPDRTGVYAVVPAGGTQPEEIERVMPHYSPMARRAGVGGPVVIRGIVRRDGTIDEVQVLKDLPYGLGDSARDAVSRWRFRPATYRGEPIDVYYTVTVNFRLE